MCATCMLRLLRLLGGVNLHQLVALAPGPDSEMGGLQTMAMIVRVVLLTILRSL